VTQGQIFQEQISTGFHHGCGQAQQKSQPAKHARHHPTKSTGSRAFSSRMELLPTTGLVPPLNRGCSSRDCRNIVLARNRLALDQVKQAADTMVDQSRITALRPQKYTRPRLSCARTAE